ncbi:MAG: T9SS type A sorting domain-containing protein, partial [candidate division Zixibacteria bacterium]
VVEFFNEPRQALYTGICSRNYIYEAPDIQLLFTHPVTVDGVIRIIDRDRRGAGEVNGSLLGLEAFPNPFNNSTRLTLQLMEDTSVKVVIYDLLGRQIAILADGNLPSGRHDIIWEAGDLPSGLYLCRVKAGDVSATEKITLLR